MRVIDKGSTFGVYVSKREVCEFNLRWPCSGLRGPHYFEFEKSSGDLVDHEGEGDGGEALALADDAQEYGCNRLKIRNTHRET